MDEIKFYENSLSVFFINTGDGDSILIELPMKNNRRRYIIVDSNDSKNSNYQKITDFLRLSHDPQIKEIVILVATHPHDDHIKGILDLLENDRLQINQYWDSGYRHNTKNWHDITKHLINNENIQFVRPTSGYYTIIDGVEINVLAPSITLRNRYDSYGVDINNSSIVLKIDYKEKSIILTGDAQWESWAKMSDEFKQFKKTDKPDLNFKIRKDFNPLDCDVLKVSHHGSKKGTSYEAVLQLDPKYSIISCSEHGRHRFPHEVAIESLKETKTNIIETYRRGTILVTIYKVSTNPQLKVYQNVEVRADGKIIGEKYEKVPYRIYCKNCKQYNPMSALFCMRCAEDLRQ